MEKPDIRTLCTRATVRDWFVNYAPGLDFTRADDYPSRRHYVYILVDDDVPFYVGLGTGRRWKQHWDKPCLYNPFKDAKIADLKRRGSPMINCVVIVKDGLTLNQAALIEQALIGAIGREPDGLLFNLSDGGDGGTFGYKWTPEQLARNAMRNPATVAKIVAKNKGKKRSLEIRERLSIAQKANTKAGQHRLGIVETAEQTAKRLNAARDALAETPHIWITDGHETKKHPLSIAVPLGWQQGRTFSEEHKSAVLAVSTGPRSDEVKANIKAGHAGIWDDPEKRERMLANRKPFSWYTDGVSSKRVHIDEDPPAGWRPGRAINAQALVASRKPRAKKEEPSLL